MNSIQSLVKYFILHKHSAVSPPFGFRTITASGSGSSTSSVDQVLVLENQQCRLGSGSSTSSVDKVLVLALSVYIRFLFQNQYCSADQVLVLVQVLQCRSVYISRTYIRFWFSYQQCISGSGSRFSSVYQVSCSCISSVYQVLVLILAENISNLIISQLRSWNLLSVGLMNFSLFVQPALTRHGAERRLGYLDMSDQISG